MGTTQVNKEVSLGESRVGISFNPSKYPEVDYLKMKTARAIDKCNDTWDDEAMGSCEALVQLCDDALGTTTESEVRRCYAKAKEAFLAANESLKEDKYLIAQDFLELGCMWAVKGITKP